MSVFGMWQEYIVHTLHTVSTQYSCNSIDKIVIVSKVERHVIEIFLAFFLLEIYYVRNVKAKGKIEIGFHRELNMLQKTFRQKQWIETYAWQMADNKTSSNTNKKN